jgi:flagellar hook-basal body complex protein FliE
MPSEIQFPPLPPSLEGPARIRQAPAAPAQDGTPVQGGTFAETLGKAIEGLDAAQGAADAEANKVAAGQGNLHEMAIALEKADISMRLAMKVRNKIVDAYNEIMRMSV